MLVLAGLGLDPWDVLHQGLSRTVGLQVGTWAIIVGAVVLLAWVPLRQRPGLGTVCNVVVIGLVINLTLAVVPAPHDAVGAGGGPRRRRSCSTASRPAPTSGPASGRVRATGSPPASPPADTHSGWCAPWSRSACSRRAGCSAEPSASGTVLYALAIGPITHLTIPALRLGTRQSHPDHGEPVRVASGVAVDPGQHEPAFGVQGQ